MSQTRPIHAGVISFKFCADWAMEAWLNLYFWNLTCMTNCNQSFILSWCVMLCVVNIFNWYKNTLLHSTVSSHWDCSKHFTLHPLTDLFIPIIDFSGKHSSLLQLLCEDYSFTYTPLSIARYSFLQLSELWQRGVNEIAYSSKQNPNMSNNFWSIWTAADTYTHKITIVLFYCPN